MGREGVAVLASGLHSCGPARPQHAIKARKKKGGVCMRTGLPIAAARAASTEAGMVGPRSLPSSLGAGSATVRRFITSSTRFPCSLASTRA